MHKLVNFKVGDSLLVPPEATFEKNVSHNIN